MGTGYTVRHASVLAAHAPQESRIVRALDPEAGWNDQTRILHSIEYVARIIAWQRTTDGEKGRNRPKPLPTPGSRGPTAEQIEASAKATAHALGIEKVI